MGYCVVCSVLLALAGPSRPGSLPGTVTFRGASDASAAVALDKDLIAVADDEDNTLRVYALTGGMPVATFDMAAFLQTTLEFPEADIEGASRVGDRVYWITSHGRNKDGKLRPNRYRFFATEIQRDGDKVSLRPVGRPCKTLVPQLLGDKALQGLGLREAAGDDLVKDAILERNRKRLAPKDEGLNIEGLCGSADGKVLYVGFRNPVPKDKALVVPMENPLAVIEQGRPAVFGRPLLWDLGGLGIRDMVYVEGLRAVFVIAGPYNEGRQFALYRWSGRADEQPVRVRQDLGREYPDFTPEALVSFASETRLLVLSDDGAREVEVAGPQECREGEFLAGGRCLNKNLLDSSRKTFRASWVSVD